MTPDEFDPDQRKNDGAFPALVAVYGVIAACLLIAAMAIF